MLCTCAMYCLPYGLIFVKLFYFKPLILLLESMVKALEKSLNFGFGIYYEPC